MLVVLVVVAEGRRRWGVNGPGDREDAMFSVGIEVVEVEGGGYRIINMIQGCVPLSPCLIGICRKYDTIYHPHIRVPH